MAPLHFQEPEGNVLRSLLTELIGPPLASEITQKDRPISLKLMNRSEPMKGVCRRFPCGYASDNC
jgi:hypothetical protein